MKTLSMRHNYPLAPRALLQAMLHPGLTPWLETRLPDLESRTELGRTVQGDTVLTRVRCVPVARIPEVAKKVVRPEMITWEEHAQINLAAGTVVVNIKPAGFGEVFSFRGHMRVTATDTGCVREAQGQLEIRMMLVGRLVEDYLGNLIESNMREEAAALGTFIAQGRHLTP